ncbi:hypothetical protein [Methanimicrococcus blatticola]|uniref:Uncharacterized protein n=1 Tax=Methanimicrococcus blatticola TaxID=91560 RepID=A0A484F675_9EURY|nr:hypothetical protein [Methanimicrococcus blatticola]MBZ3935097.1 hypothetical protein [Methanimicrococcus blatticola]MCC2508806.1 hypothetical protein [Methanimicrococcus blatticola]TDQ71164.1 hypothetical protein C7391_0268 [Methanimicrococcus blatticola]
MQKKLNLFFMIIIITTSFFAGCLTNEQNSEEEQENPSRLYRWVQVVGPTASMRFGLTEDTAIEYWTYEEKPKGIVFCEDLYAVVPESTDYVTTVGSHQWEFYGRKNGTVEVDFKLLSLSDNSIKEQFVAQLDVDENDNDVKIISVHQLKAPDTPLETELTIKENKTIDIMFQEYSNPNNKWVVEEGAPPSGYTPEGILKMVGEEINSSQNSDLNIHKWEFEGEKTGYVRLIYKAEASDGTRADEVIYDLYVNEDMTVELAWARYNLYIYDVNLNS